jgi:hypothetical protein
MPVGLLHLLTCTLLAPAAAPDILSPLRCENTAHRTAAPKNTHRTRRAPILRRSATCPATAPPPDTDDDEEELSGKGRRLGGGLAAIKPAAPGPTADVADPSRQHYHFAVPTPPLFRLFCALLL